MENDTKETRVGVGVMIFKEGKVLLGKRKSLNKTDGYYQFPGGRMDEVGEKPMACALREVAEECGLKVKNLKFVCLSYLTDWPSRVGIGFKAEWDSGEPVCVESDKCDGWEWYSLDHLPSPIFPITQVVIDAHQNREVYIER